MRFFGLKTCDTSRKALAALRAAGREPTVIDIRADGLAAGDIVAIVATFGPAAVNKSSTTWRGLSDADRALPSADLLARHPTVMKRPVIDDDGRWTIGWDAAVRASFGL